MLFKLEQELTERIGFNEVLTDLKWQEDEKAFLIVDGKEIKRRVYFDKDLFVWIKGNKIFYSDEWSGYNV